MTKLFYIIICGLLLSATPAFTFSVGGSSACPMNNKAVGAVIWPSTLGCSLFTAQGPTTWNFVGSSVAPGYALEANGSNYGIPTKTDKAELCSNTGTGYPIYVGIEIPAQAGGVPATYQAMAIQYEVNLQASSICSPARDYFMNTTTGKAFDTAQQSLATGDTSEWKAPPSGLIWGQNGNLMATADITTPNVTINLDAGFVASGVSALEPPGHDPINVQASNVSIVGASSATVTLEHNTGGGDDAIGQIDVISGFTNIKLSGMTLSWADQNLNFGGGNGAITLNDIQAWYGGVQGVAGNFGQQHNIYLSNSGVTGNDGPVTVTALQSYDVQTGGYLFKDRVNNTTITGSYFGCTLAPTTAKPGCEMNTPIDFPCAGNQSVTHNVLERNLVEADTEGSAPVFIRYGEEVSTAAATCSEAVGAGYTTNSLTLDSDILLNDSPPWSGYVQPWYAVQMGCNWHTSGMSCSCVIKNSVIVGNDKATYGGLSLAGGAGASGTCTDGGGNRVFADRAAAAAALGWSGPDRFGNPCCAFPWQPAHI